MAHLFYKCPCAFNNILASEVTARFTFYDQFSNQQTSSLVPRD